MRFLQAAAPRWALVLCFLLTWPGASLSAHAQGPNWIVDTKQGPVQGLQEGPLHVFRGIPYAQPPMGALRFRPPQPPRPHSAVLAAIKFGPRATQAGPTGTQGAEDCLYLNVWAPQNNGRQQHPVVVWVHGGAFTGGSGQDHDSWTFAARDSIVVVSFNYRLGSLGFLQLGATLGKGYEQAGNCGLLDAVAALRWVHANISAFGGDPRRVTVMGESAGAKLVGALLATPAAKGLFQQVILESGAVQAIRDTATAGAVARQLLQALGGPAQRLLTLPADSLVRAQARFTSGAGGLQVFGPVLDGRTIPAPPLELLRRQAPPVRVLLGTNLEEARLFSGAGSILATPNAAALDKVFGTHNGPLVWQAYQQRQKTIPDALDAWNTTLTDYLYRLATYRLARQLAAQGLPTWLYRFDYADATTRPIHAQELAFVWNAPRGSSAEATAAPSTAPGKAANPALAALMHAHWVSFIRSGRPGPDWPMYTPARPMLMVFKADSQTELSKAPYEDASFPMQGYWR
ncbi:carboxylesterase family protein [Hymenobacter sp. ASUV-10]|uniref:Carboxylic ester hydrolase n=1 Tax=Hymenobacter aranciens TaxID=3063996 RepID=A0ABT9BBJ5_9BACT|nr:carboxylesterase family protein [Hymenobacter sp. ASUV-10]MDO7875644.1 carboxylesterase family protein [Hymenobacter sp. ASUV-10]